MAQRGIKPSKLGRYKNTYISLISKESNIWYIGENVLIIVNRFSLNLVPILPRLKPDNVLMTSVAAYTVPITPQQSGLSLASWWWWCSPETLKDCGT